MKARVLFAALLAVVCLGEFWILSGQRRELAGMRAAQQQSAAQTTSVATTAPVASQILDDSTSGSPSGIAATSELLKLRSQVTRLEERRRELASVTAQNRSLRAQLASQSTNGATGIRLPPGYIRVSNAQFVGYGSPAATLQTFLWALRNHDGARLLQALSPEMAKEFPSGDKLEKEFDEAGNSIVGMAIVESRQQEDGSIRAKIQMGEDGSTQSAVFRQTNGEWKMSEAPDGEEQ